MIQDITPHEFHNEYQNILPEPDDPALFFVDGKALVADETDGSAGRALLPRVSDFPGASFRYLFTVDESRFFLVDGNEEPPRGFRPEPIRVFRKTGPKELAFAITVGFHLNNWYQAHKYCGACGSPTEHSDRERALVCPECGNTVYPTISPAVIVGVIHDGKILMTKYAGRSFKNYALIAGFNEIGESIEQTVHREVMEEVGLPVKNLRYYKSQPWPFSSSLLMGFFCELDGDSDQITLDQNELSEAGWFGPEDVPDDIEHAALTAEMMTVFKNGLL